MLNNYDEILTTNDFYVLLNHCKAAVIENKNNNDGPFQTWTDANHIIEVYLDGHTFFDNYPDEFEQLKKALNDWLSDMKTDELSN